MTEEAIFAAGCFWGIEAAFMKEKGVVETHVGYTGGHTDNPTYGEVCTGKTGHAEALRVVFDPAHISYDGLLELFFSIHDPTTLNRQGPDVGEQYRSIIFYKGEEQKRRAEDFVKKLEEKGAFSRKIVTEITPATTFFPAEEYHQKYLEKTGKGVCH